MDSLSSYLLELNSELHSIVDKLTTRLRTEYEQRPSGVQTGKAAVDAMVLLEVSDIGYLLNTITAQVETLRHLLATSSVDIAAPYPSEQTMQERCNDLWERLRDRVHPLGDPTSIMNMSPISGTLLAIQQGKK